MTTPLAEVLRARIRSEGPIGVDAYMDACLNHPDHGYYQRADAIGAEGDFVTAPEVSQVFGELIGIWLLQIIAATPVEGPWTLIELGPGRGTLMSDLIRVLGAHVGAKDVQIALVEKNETLQEAQEQRLADAALPCRWFADLADVPSGPSLVIANEFLDVLPIRQFQMSDAGWRERLVGLDADGGFTFMLDDRPAEGVSFPDAEVGLIAEHCPGFVDLAGQLARLHNAGSYASAALFVDYGFSGPPTSTKGSLQAVSRHRYVDVFSEPGCCDLTAYVNFSAVSQALGQHGFQSGPLLAQGAFLDAMGIGLRLDALMQAEDARVRNSLEAGVARLVSPDAMGERFKVLCATAGNVEMPYPFVASDQSARLGGV